MKNIILMLFLAVISVSSLTACETIDDLVSGDSCLDRVIDGKEVTTETAVQANLSHLANFISDEDRDAVFVYTDKAMNALNEAQDWCLKDEVTASDYLDLAYTFINETEPLLERKY